MRILPKIFFLTLVCCLFLMEIDVRKCCADFIKSPLKTASAESGEVNGRFDVILFGGAYSDDLETVALLDVADDQYILEPFAPAFSYTVKSALSAEEALAVAGKFVSFHPSFWKMQLIKIIAPDGTIVGFELKPLYLPILYGRSDVLDIHYWPQEKAKIKVTIKLIPSLEKLKFHPGADNGYNRGN